MSCGKETHCGKLAATFQVIMPCLQSMRNIWQKVRKSNKIGKDQKTLISAFLLEF